EHDLPVAIHVGAEGTGIANPPTGVGYPTTYLEFHTDHSQTMMAHCVSLVAEGVFEEFPTLKFAFIEGGVCWAPYVMWRLDRIYPALRQEVPYLKRLPSEYILDHCYFSTQPIEEPDNHGHLLQMLAMLRAEKTVVFASDYPHWDFDNPLLAFAHFPPGLKRRVFVAYAPAGLRHRVARKGGPPLARHGFKFVGERFGDAPLPPENGGNAHPAADPRWVKEQYLDRRGVDLAILTGSLTSLGVQPNADMAAAVARGVNDWTLETWVRPFDCFKGSILVAPQDPAQAVAEIDRLADDPGVVQVLLGSATEA